MSFSIITTVFNSQDFINDCLESIKSQSMSKKKIEHLIIDAGSTDNTIRIIKEFRKKNKHIKLFIKKDCSIYEGLNIGIKKAKNKYIGIMHSDDFYHNTNVLKDIEKKFKSNKNLDGVYSNVSFVKRFNKKKIIRVFKSKEFSKKELLKCEHPPHTSLFLKNNYFKLSSL